MSTSYYFWKWAENDVPGKPAEVWAALLRGELHPALQSFDARPLLNALEDAAAELRTVDEEWEWKVHPPTSPEKACFVFATCCKRRLNNVALVGACVTAEKRGALEPTRERVSKACNGTIVTSLPPPRGSRECTRTWNCGAKCAVRC
jgi:hypothetical protein